MKKPAGKGGNFEPGAHCVPEASKYNSQQAEQGQTAINSTDKGVSDGNGS